MGLPCVLGGARVQGLDGGTICAMLGDPSPMCGANRSAAQRQPGGGAALSKRRKILQARADRETNMNYIREGISEQKTRKEIVFPKTHHTKIFHQQSRQLESGNGAPMCVGWS